MTTPTATRPAQVFLADPHSRIMELDQPLACPVFPGLTFEALAAAPGAQHYLVLRVQRPGLPTIVVHIGPDETTVARRGFLLVAGLRSHGDIDRDLVEGVAILRWLADCWTVLREEIADGGLS